MELHEAKKQFPNRIRHSPSFAHFLRLLRFFFSSVSSPSAVGPLSDDPADVEEAVAVVVDEEVDTEEEEEDVDEGAV